MIKQTGEKFIVCCALPYANGGLHLGHLAVAYLPGDIYARYRRMQGHDVHFVCGSDEHGAAITFRAREEGITPQAVVDKYHKVIKDSLEECGIKFDIFSRTTHECHAKRSQDFFLNLQKNGLLEKRTEKRLHCASCNQFLPERYVVGSCPTCGKGGARGDQCEKCGSWYEPEALVDPICQLCKTNKASLKETTHWYFELQKLEPKLRAWLESKQTGEIPWRKNVLGYAFQPLKAELTGRAITRDLDWGVPVPLAEAKDKVLYVWFDAPIGYISASEDWAIRQGQPDKWKHYWEDKNSHLIHFIGKDNIIFHTVFWPCILMGDGRYVLPDLVAGNEFLNLEGEKFSTSRNYALWLDETLKIVPADNLRYYLATILPETSDSNFYWDEYQSRINTELADTIGNLSNRCLSFINKNYEGIIAPEGAKCDPAVAESISVAYEEYCKQLNQGLAKVALAAVIDLGRKLNVYFQEQAPWKVRKEDPVKAHGSLYSVSIGIKAIALMLTPYVPGISQKMWNQLGLSSPIENEALEEAINLSFPTGHKISPDVSPIVTKIEDTFIAAQKEALQARIKK